MAQRPSTPRFRIALIALALLLGFLALVTQLLRLQVVEHDALGASPADQAPSAPVANPNRGTIVDINGAPLAFDMFRWEIWVEPYRIPQALQAPLVSKLAEVLGAQMSLSPDALLAELGKQEHRVIMLTRTGTQGMHDTLAAWEKDRKDGRTLVAMNALPKRMYPQGSLASHLLGFVNVEPQAFYGVEQQYDQYLRSLNTPFINSYPDVVNFYKNLPAGWDQALPSAAGQDLVLTIDRRIQYITERTLAQAVSQYRADGGTIIVMEPKTGAILAMASLPNYDPNNYAAANSEALADPAISRQYEPGSVFKIITMAAGIDSGVITPTTMLTDTLSIVVGDREIFNSNFRTFGEVTAREALVRSLNIPTAEVALKLKEGRFYQYVHRFGFGQLTEVDLANEGPGSVKAPGDDLWSRSDLATNAFGQGLAVTPLQMATATCVIANGGLLVRPHVVDTMLIRGRMEHPDLTPVRRVIKPSTAAAVTDMMISVAEEGSPAAKVQGFTVAGKTGTAQIPIAGTYHPTATIHSFVGFVPAENPAFVALVKLDVPKTHPWADSTAAPTFSRLATEILRILRIPAAQVANRP